MLLTTIAEGIRGHFVAITLDGAIATGISPGDMVATVVAPDQSFVAVGGYPAETITLKFPDAWMLGQRQDVEGIMGAQEGVQSASVDSQRGSCAPFGDPRALLF